MNLRGELKGATWAAVQVSAASASAGMCLPVPARAVTRRSGPHGGVHRSAATGSAGGCVPREDGGERFLALSLWSVISLAHFCASVFEPDEGFIHPPPCVWHAFPNVLAKQLKILGS